jgi:hypothetical protein
MMPAGRNKCENGISTDAAAAGTWLRIRNTLLSQLSIPVLSNSADTPNSAAPRPATSPAVRAVGTLTGRFGHHHESGEITEPDRRSGALRPPGWMTSDLVPESSGLEVDWWRAHWEFQHAPGPAVPSDALLESVTRLYCCLVGEVEAAVRPAAVHRVRAIDLSDQWVREGCRPGSLLLPLEHAALVRAYAALLATVHYD